VETRTHAIGGGPEAGTAALFRLADSIISRCRRCQYSLLSPDKDRLGQCGRLRPCRGLHHAHITEAL